MVDAVKQEKNATRGNVGNENMDENVDDPPPILVMTKKYSTAMCYISTGVLPNARAKSNKEKVKIERLLSAEEKVEPVKSKSREEVENKVKSKGREEVEKREKLRLELTRLEKKEAEKKDQIQSQFQIQVEFENKRILEQETKIKQVESSKKENSEKLAALIDQMVKFDAEFDKQIDEAKEERKEAIIQRSNANALTALTQKEIALIQEQLETVRKDLHLAEGGGKVGELEGFMDRQILELESELKCPVCFEVARTSPIYKCSDDHLICR